MGAGKTTVGRAIARRLDRPFFDSDHEIEARTGARIPVIFELEGEAGFREREASVISELTGRDNIVLATGGGAVLRPENRAALQSRGVASSTCARIRTICGCAPGATRIVRFCKPKTPKRASRRFMKCATRSTGSARISS